MGTQETQPSEFPGLILGGPGVQSYHSWDTADREVPGKQKSQKLKAPATSAPGCHVTLNASPASLLTLGFSSGAQGHGSRCLRVVLDSEIL